MKSRREAERQWEEFGSESESWVKDGGGLAVTLLLRLCLVTSVSVRLRLRRGEVVGGDGMSQKWWCRRARRKAGETE